MYRVTATCSIGLLLCVGMNYHDRCLKAGRTAIAGFTFFFLNYVLGCIIYIIRGDVRVVYFAIFWEPKSIMMHKNNTSNNDTGKY